MHVQSKSTTSVAKLISGTVPDQATAANAWIKAILSWGNTLRLASFCLLAYWIAIFIGTHLPSSSLPHLVGSDKMLHFGAFGGLVFLVAWALPTRQGNSLHRGMWTLGLVIGYALIDELTQKLVPGRTCSAGDFIADAIGAFIGLGAYFATKAVLVKTQIGQRLILTFSK